MCVALHCFRVLGLSGLLCWAPGVKYGGKRRTFGARAQASLRSALASLAPPAWSDECPYICKSPVMRCVLLPFCVIACGVGSMSWSARVHVMTCMRMDPQPSAGSVSFSKARPHRPFEDL